MAKILLDYVFPISVIPSIPAASTAWLRKVCVVVLGKDGVDPGFYDCTTAAQIALKTDNEEAQQLLNAGMSKITLLVATSLDMAAALATQQSAFYTILISSDFEATEIFGVKASLVKQTYLTFTAQDPGEVGNDISIIFQAGEDLGLEHLEVSDKQITFHIASTQTPMSTIKTIVEASPEASALISVSIESGHEATAVTWFAEDNLVGGTDPTLDVGTFEGVIGMAFADKDQSQAFAVTAYHCGFYSAANGAKNMMYAFGKLLSSASWRNQQYLELPVSDGITALGDAIDLFDNRVSFGLDDDEFSKRLGLFAVGGKAIVAPYVLKEVRINLQSAATSWIALNQPTYTKKNASLLEQNLSDTVIRPYVERGDIESGTVSIEADQDNFVASGSVSIPTPRALWRVQTEMQET